MPDRCQHFFIYILLPLNAWFYSIKRWRRFQHFFSHFMLWQSLKERSVPPAVEDGNFPPMQYSLESYVHQEPLSPSASYPIPSTGLQGADNGSFALNYGSLSVDEKKEFLVITRNSLDLLSSILNNDTEPKPLKVIY